MMKLIQGRRHDRRPRGDDLICGGEGNDTIYGGSGNDSLLGGEENAWIDAGSGHDLVNGQGGNDKLSGGTGRNILVQGGASERVRDRWTDRHGYTGPRGVAVYSDQ